MAFTDVYRGLFKNINDVDCVIRIQEEHNVAPPRIMSLGAVPCVIETTKSQIQNTIFGSGCEINIISEEGDDYSHIFLGAPQTKKVIVEEADEVIFMGFIDTKFYTQQFLAPPFELSLTATDGLKELEDYMPIFLGLDPSLQLIKGIQLTLERTGLSLPIEVKCTLASEDMDLLNGSTSKLLNSQRTTMFDKAQSLLSAADGMNVRDILEALLRSANCKIYQDGTVWRIDRLNDKFYRAENAKYIRYVNGIVEDLATTKTSSIIEVGGDVGDGLEWLEANQIKEIQQPYATQRITGEISANTEKVRGVVSNFTHSIGVVEPATSLANLSNVGGNETFTNQDTLINLTPLLEGYYAPNVMMNYPKGGYKFDSATIESMGADPLNHWWNTFIGFKTAVSFENWEKDSISDSINISFRANGIRGNAADELFTGGTWGYTKKSTIFPIAIIVETPAGARKWLKWDGTKNGYIFEDYNNANAEKYKIDTIQDTLSAQWGQPESTTVNFTMTNGKKTEYKQNSLDINESLTTYTKMYVLIYYPYVTFTVFVNNSYWLDRIVGGGSTWIGGVDVSGVSIEYNSLSKYNNTYDGILDGAFTSRQAPELKLNLWNPTRVGDGPIERGLVSESSSWVNRNVKTNIYKYYGDYTDLSKIDDNGGLGLWYSLKDLFNANFVTKDLGHRLPVDLMASYYRTFSETQDVYEGVVKANTKPSYRNVYSVADSSEGKQFILLGSEYNIRDSQAKIRLFELKEDEILINT